MSVLMKSVFRALGLTAHHLERLHARSDLLRRSVIAPRSHTPIEIHFCGENETARGTPCTVFAHLLVRPVTQATCYILFRICHLDNLQSFLWKSLHKTGGDLEKLGEKAWSPPLFRHFRSSPRRLQICHGRVAIETRAGGARAF